LGIFPSQATRWTDPDEIWHGSIGLYRGPWVNFVVSYLALIGQGTGFASYGALGHLPPWLPTIFFI